jgi:hypothetical protein
MLCLIMLLLHMNNHPAKPSQPIEHIYVSMQKGRRKWKRGGDEQGTQHVQVWPSAFFVIPFPLPLSLNQMHLHNYSSHYLSPNQAAFWTVKGR